MSIVKDIKYLTVTDHVALRGSLITNCITFLMQVNVVMGKQLISQSGSNFALRGTAKDNEKQYGKEITQILERGFCVDNLLESFPTVDKAVYGIKQLQELYSRGAFNLTKFISNKQELIILGNLPEEKAQGVKRDTQNWLINI